MTFSPISFAITIHRFNARHANLCQWNAKQALTACLTIIREKLYFSSILNVIFNTISAYAIIFLHPTLHHIMRFMHSSENIFTKTDLVMKFISSRVWCFRSAFSKNETTNKVKSNQFSGLWFLKISSTQKMSWLGIRSGRNKDNKQLVRPLKKIEFTAGGKNNFYDSRTWYLSPSTNVC